MKSKSREKIKKKKIKNKKNEIDWFDFQIYIWWFCFFVLIFFLHQFKNFFNISTRNFRKQRRKFLSRNQSKQFPSVNLSKKKKSLPQFWKKEINQIDWTNAKYFVIFKFQFFLDSGFRIHFILQRLQKFF